MLSPGASPRLGIGISPGKASYEIYVALGRLTENQSVRALSKRCRICSTNVDKRRLLPASVRRVGFHPDPNLERVLTRSRPPSTHLISEDDLTELPLGQSGQELIFSAEVLSLASLVSAYSDQDILLRKIEMFARGVRARLSASAPSLLLGRDLSDQISGSQRLGNHRHRNFLK